MKELSEGRVIVNRDGGFGRCAPYRAGSELQLTIDDRAVLHEEVVAQGDVAPLPEPAGTLASGRGERDLYAVGELLAGRATAPASRKQ